jgi:ankyrin repeat protein
MENSSQTPRFSRDVKTIPDDLDSSDLQRGQTPLLWLCRHRNFDAIQKLVGLGADVNKPDNDGTTPLHIAGEKT